jgi:hypothetical protein
VRTASSIGRNRAASAENVRYARNGAACGLSCTTAGIRSHSAGTSATLIRLRLTDRLTQVPDQPSRCSCQTAARNGHDQSG